MIKKIFQIAALLILIFFLILVAVLGKAHWDIRQVNPALPALEDIDAKLNAANGPVQIRYLLNASQSSPDGSAMTHSSFLFEWSDGTHFLLDVGMDEQGTVEFGEISESAFGADPIQFHGTIADQLGSAATRVTGMAFTHLHQDHTGGAAALCRKSKQKISIFQTEWQADWGNIVTDMGRVLLDDAACLSFAKLPEPEVNTVPGFPGLVTISAGGHTPGSTIYAAKVDGYTWLFSGDITNSKQDLLTNTPKALWYSTLMVPESRKRLETLRTWLASIDRLPHKQVVVSHDLEALQKSGLPKFRIQSADPRETL
ncbi:MAG: MBL fold metallo-hydrolase [Pseudomonadales bacterium]